MRSFGLLLLSLFVLGFPVKTIVEKKTTGMEVKKGLKIIVIKWEEKIKEQDNRGGKLWWRNGDRSSEGLVALSQW